LGESYTIKDDVCFLCICDRSYPRKLAFTYLADLATEFTTTYPPSQYHSPSLRPYAFIQFDTFIQRTKTTYQDSRASQNLDKLNDELRDVTKVMTKNIEDLLYRGDSLERMGELSGRLREDSRKYKKAAVRINWELLLKQVSQTSLCETWLSKADHLAVWALCGSWASDADFDMVAFFLVDMLQYLPNI
jgi:vesicle transport protein SEC22